MISKSAPNRPAARIEIRAETINITTKANTTQVQPDREKVNKSPIKTINIAEASTMRAYNSRLSTYF